MIRILTVTCVFAAGCGAALQPATEAELAQLADDELGTIDEASAALEAARDAQSALEARRVAVERDVEIAEYTIRRETADVEIARLRFEAAQATKDADAMIPARAERERSQRALAIANAELAWREAALDHLEATIDESAAAVEVAEAELALARVVAVQGAGDGATTPEAVERKAAFDTRVANSKATLAGETQTVARLAAVLQRAKEAHAKAAGGTVKSEEESEPPAVDAPPEAAEEDS